MIRIGQEYRDPIRDAHFDFGGPAAFVPHAAGLFGRVMGVQGGSSTTTGKGGERAA